MSVNDWYRKTQRQDYNDRTNACTLRRVGICTTSYRVNDSEIVVVRDDTLCGGTKSRISREYLLSLDYEEYVYVTPWHGGAQIALALHVQESTGKAVFFTHDFQGETPAYVRIAQSFGGRYSYAAHPYDAAKRYVDEDPTKRVLIPSGFKTLQNIQRIGKIAKEVKKLEGDFDETWCAVGSGCLILGLQEENLSKKYYGVCVFNTCPDMGNAIPIIPSMDFNTPVSKEDKPPYPSSSHYDAKVWKYVYERAKENPGRYLMWNVL